MGKSKTKSLNSSSSSYTDFYYHFFRNILVVSLPLLVISALILGFAIPHSSARISSSDSLAISVPSSCTLASSVDEAHSASIINGTYRSDIGTTTLSTFCNDKNGYSVYAIGDSLNSEGNNTLVGSNGSNINSGTATSGDTSNWAMKLALKAGDTSTTLPTIIPPFNNYATVPTTWTKVATIPSSTTDMEKGSNFTTTYATYISPTQAAGTYIGQVKYLLTHPSVATPTSAYIMQEVADWEDDLPNPGDSVQAIDIRDGKQYWVTRLADGNIWMTQNLDFDISASTTLNSNTTDLNVLYDPSTGQYQEYSDGYTKNNNIIYWAPDATNGKYNLPVNGTSVPDWSNQDNYPYSADPGDVYYYTSNSTSDDIKYTSLSNCTTAGHTEGECKHYHAGNYYNWTAAIASNNSSSLAIQYTNAPNSICPKGWRLPIATNANQSTYEFGELLYKQDIIATKTSTSYTENSFNKIRTMPLWLMRAGGIGGDTLHESTRLGRYWSSTVLNSSNAYYLEFGNSNILPAKNFGRSRGWAIRCLAW